MQDDSAALQYLLRELEHDREWAGKGTEEQVDFLLQAVERAKLEGKPIVKPGAWDDRPLTRAQVYRAFGYYEQALQEWEHELVAAYQSGNASEQCFLLIMLGA